ncbi:hypothetical protein [Bacteroides faecichinchillae]|uniref:hypothetical protein n=1 Tax=Bacteroides faecichinchillae TaxID=871325 RepID=UPI0023B90D80|nr:hypothetical protein [Bacteroides faecichinchillae]
MADTSSTVIISGKGVTAVEEMICSNIPVRRSIFSWSSATDRGRLSKDRCGFSLSVIYGLCLCLKKGN